MYLNEKQSNMLNSIEIVFGSEEEEIILFSELYELLRDTYCYNEPYIYNDKKYSDIISLMELDSRELVKYTFGKYNTVYKEHIEIALGQNVVRITIYNNSPNKDRLVEYFENFIDIIKEMNIKKLDVKDLYLKTILDIKNYKDKEILKDNFFSINKINNYTINKKVFSMILEKENFLYNLIVSNYNIHDMDNKNSKLLNVSIKNKCDINSLNKNDVSFEKLLESRNNILSDLLVDELKQNFLIKS